MQRSGGHVHTDLKNTYDLISQVSAVHTALPCEHTVKRKGMPLSPDYTRTFSTVAGPCWLFQKASILWLIQTFFFLELCIWSRFCHSYTIITRFPFGKYLFTCRFAPIRIIFQYSAAINSSFFITLLQIVRKAGLETTIVQHKFCDQFHVSEPLICSFISKITQEKLQHVAIKVQIPRCNILPTQYLIVITIILVISNVICLCMHEP